MHYIKISHCCPRDHAISYVISLITTFVWLLGLIGAVGVREARQRKDILHLTCTSTRPEWSVTNTRKLKRCTVVQPGYESRTTQTNKANTDKLFCILWKVSIKVHHSFLWVRRKNKQISASWSNTSGLKWLQYINNNSAPYWRKVYHPPHLKNDLFRSVNVICQIFSFS